MDDYHSTQGVLTRVWGARLNRAGNGRNRKIKTKLAGSDNSVGYAQWRMK